MATQRLPPYYLPPSPGWEPPKPPRPLFVGAVVTSLCFGIFGLFAFAAAGTLGLLFGVTAVAFAVIALHRVSKGPGAGRGAAIWGLILGLLFALGGLGKAVSATNSTTTASSASSNTAAAPVTKVAAAPTAPAQGAPAPTIVNAKNIGDDYEANKFAAAKKWGDQYVQFTSKVGNITSAWGKPYVSFQDVTSKFSFTSITCYASAEQLAALVNTSPPPCAASSTATRRWASST